MGLPVVTLAGKAHAARVGASLLGAAGVPSGVANSADEYAACARRLAEQFTPLDAGPRARARQILRDGARSSELCNAKDFAGRLEAALVGAKGAGSTPPDART